MMIIDIKEVESCFNSIKILELVILDEININFINKLKKIGNLFYYPDFPKPFFKFQIKGICEMKGVEGYNKLRIVLLNPNEYPIDYVITLLNDI